jgi:outer membrane protein TolC
LNLEVRLAQAREDLIRAQNGMRLSIAALNTAIGEDLVGPDGLPIPVKKDGVPPPIEKDANLVENRPELHLAKRRTSIKKKEYHRAVREYYPHVNAFGSYDFDSDFDELEDSYLVGIMAEWEFFDGFRRASTIKQIKREWQAAQQDEQNIRNNLRLDLQRAQIQAAEAWQRLEVVRKSVESAKEALRITRVRYKEGATDITELLTAQVGLTASQTRDIAAYYDYLIALSNVRRAQGELVTEYVD